MNNDNPAEMSNQDLEKDMQQYDEYKNQENVNKSTAAEGTLKTPDEDQSSAINNHTAFNRNEEQDLDDLVHSQSNESDSQDGSMPDPESLDTWESNDDDPNKLSS